MKYEMRWTVLILLMLAGVVSSHAQVSVYHVPKEKPVATAEAHQQTDTPARPLNWTKPTGWKELPGDSMRVATFSIVSDGRQAQATIVPIGGKGGTLADNVNRWRSQLELGPIAPSAISTQVTAVAVGSTQGDLFEASGTLQGRATRMVVAVLSRDDTAWFFKFVGEDSLVAAQKPAFLNFLKSVSFNDGVVRADVATRPVPAGADFAAIHQGMNLGGVDLSARVADTGNHPAWNIPADWKQVAASPMLVSKFQVSGAGDARADVNVSTGPGLAGGPAANINRWRAQLGLAAVDEAGVAKLISHVDVSGCKAMLVDMSGSDPESGDDKQLVALIIPFEGQTWFYKLMGTPAIVEKQKAALITFAQSTQFNAH